MNILFIVEYYWPHTGGVEVMFQNLAEGLAKKGHHIEIVTQRLPKTARKETRKGVHITRVRSPNRYFFTFLAFPATIRKAKEADVVHTTTFNGAPPAWLAAKLHGKPVLLTVHEVWIGFWKKLDDMSIISRLLHDFGERLLYTLPFDRYVCVSKSTQRQLQRIGVNKRKINVVYNGIDYHHFRPRKARKSRVFTLLAYGRPGVSKGFEYLVDAMPRVKNKVHLELILSRDKAYRTRWQRIVAKRGKNISIRPPVAWEKMPEVIAAADCIIVPSLSEGFGYAAAQAVAMNKPVIASNTTSLPEVIGGKHILVPPKDSKALAEAIDRAVEGKYDEKKARKFTIDENVRNYLALYESLCGKS
jgi:D-inositol-3-phosphate glycosyltransferase